MLRLIGGISEGDGDYLLGDDMSLCIAWGEVDQQHKGESSLRTSPIFHFSVTHAKWQLYPRAPRCLFHVTLSTYQRSVKFYCCCSIDTLPSDKCEWFFSFYYKKVKLFVLVSCVFVLGWCYNEETAGCSCDMGTTCHPIASRRVFGE